MWRRRSTEELAADIGVPRDHVQKIVQELAAAGLVRTQRGAGGGVVLAGLPALIRIGEVVRRLEADQALVECFRGDGGACCFSPTCRLASVLGLARDIFTAVMGATTLTARFSRLPHIVAD